MKTLIILLVVAFNFSCSRQAVEKPDDLIEKEKMIEIFYDLAILDAIRSQMPIVLENNHINPDRYIYKKYNIDSLQFARSNQFYASDVASYKQMYEEVSKRLGETDKAAGVSDSPQVK